MSRKKPAPNQTALDLSEAGQRRGRQLRLLEQLQMQSGRAQGRAVSAASRKAVLRAIDDAIGGDSGWNISIDRLCSATLLSRGTVNAAIASLRDDGLIDVSERYEATSTSMARLPSRFSIQWEHVEKLVTERPDPRLTMRLPPSHCETTPRLTMRPPPSHSETVPAHVPAQLPDHSPPSVASATKVDRPDAGNGEGKELLWRRAVAEPQIVTAAVRHRDVKTIAELWSEASAAGWVRLEDRDTRRRFLAALWYVTHPPDGFPIDNPARVLRQKLIQRDWKTGRSDGADDDWARRIERELDGTSTLPRTADLSDHQPARTTAGLHDQIAALRQLSAVTVRCPR